MVDQCRGRTVARGVAMHGGGWTFAAPLSEHMHSVDSLYRVYRDVTRCRSVKETTTRKDIFIDRVDYSVVQFFDQPSETCPFITHSQ